MQGAAGTILLQTTALPSAAATATLLSANGSIALLRRKTDGAIETAWGGAQATATQTLANWAGARKIAVSWNAGRVVIAATGASAVGANNAPEAVTTALLGSLTTAAANGYFTRLTGFTSFNDTAAIDTLVA